MPIVEEPIDVIYPPEELRVSHFHSVRDPARIIVRVIATLVETRYMTRPPRQSAVPPRPARARAGAPAPLHHESAAGAILS